MSSGKKFYRNVISGADFTADVETAHDPELACMHRDGHCRKTVMWYAHHLPESMEGSYQGQSVPAPSQICAQQAFEEKVTCAS